MILRCLAACVILMGCGFLGIAFAGRFKSRVRQLELLENVMQQLEFDIDYTNITLAEAFERIAANTEGVLREVFGYASRRLKTSPGCDMERLWRRAFTKYRDELALTDNDIQIFLDFSKSLGTGNREKEKNNIKVTAMRLKMSVTEAHTEAEKNMKMYRGMGFLLGIFMVIILV